MSTRIQKNFDPRMHDLQSANLMTENHDVVGSSFSSQDSHDPSHQDTSFPFYPSSRPVGQPGYGAAPSGARPGAPGTMGPMGNGGPTIFLVPTRGVGTCSGAMRNGMVQLPSMFSMDINVLNFLTIMNRERTNLSSFI